MSEKRSPDYPNPRSHLDDGPSPEMAANEARQGVKGHNARYVLIIGTIGAVVAVGLAYLAFFPA